jgi:hypothetical protein
MVRDHVASFLNAISTKSGRKTSLAGKMVSGSIPPVFGFSRGYQGWKLMLLITVYGVCFGVFARWRRSLRPGMLAHALQDTAGGVLTFLMR